MWVSVLQQLKQAPVFVSLLVIDELSYTLKPVNKSNLQPVPSIFSGIKNENTYRSFQFQAGLLF